MLAVLVARVARNKHLLERHGFGFTWWPSKEPKFREEPHGRRYELAIYEDGAHPFKFASIIRGRIVNTDEGEQFRPDGFLYPGNVGVFRWARDFAEREYGGDVLPRRSLLDVPNSVPDS